MIDKLLCSSSKYIITQKDANVFSSERNCVIPTRKFLVSTRSAYPVVAPPNPRRVQALLEPPWRLQSFWSVPLHVYTISPPRPGVASLSRVTTWSSGLTSTSTRKDTVRKKLEVDLFSFSSSPRRRWTFLLLLMQKDAFTNQFSDPAPAAGHSDTSTCFGFYIINDPTSTEPHRV